MRLQTSLILLRGNHLSQVEKLLAGFSFVGHKTQSLSRWVQVEETLKSPDVKCACLCRDWTAIIDPEMTFYSDDRALSTISKSLGKVIAVIYDSESRSLGFRIFDNGQKIRAARASDNYLIEDFGSPLPEEKAPIDEINTLQFMDLMESIALDYTNLETASEFLIFASDAPPASQSLSLAQPPASSPINSSPPSPKTLRPWWKFWS